MKWFHMEKWQALKPVEVAKDNMKTETKGYPLQNKNNKVINKCFYPFKIYADIGRSKQFHSNSMFFFSSMDRCEKEISSDNCW